ncbi:hypothetical protein J2X38_002604 [Sphingopyxis sp. BE235]|nr:hypothetical protein [Sphingopyxis sp. BE235]MDR7179934.1 hypothetical protein [Sphingopyxis sp. BE249]
MFFILDPGPEQFEITVHDLKQIVEIMREPGGELTDCLHLLGLLRRLFALSPPRHIELACEEMQKLAASVINRSDKDRIPERRPIALVVQYLEGDRLAVRDCRPEVRDKLAIGLRPLQETAVPPENLGLFIAGQIEEGLVREDDRIIGNVRIGQDHRHPGHLDCGEEDIASLVEARMGQRGFASMIAKSGPSRRFGPARSGVELLMICHAVNSLHFARLAGGSS